MLEITTFVRPGSPEALEMLMTAGRLGLTDDFILPPAQHSFSSEFEDLISPQHYLGREHFGYYADTNPLFQGRTRLVGRIFNDCVQCAPAGPSHIYTYNRDRLAKPANRSTVNHLRELIVRPRLEVGLKPLATSSNTMSTVCQKYVINAGSLVDLLPALDKVPLTKGSYFLASLATKLAAQFV